MTDCDHRGMQTPVRDQLQRGACVGFAVSAAHEWMQPGQLRSVEDALWAAHQMGGNPASEGTTVQRALDGLQQHRHAEEAAWPYGCPAFPASRPLPAQDPGRQVDLPQWRRLAPSDFDSISGEVLRAAAVVLAVGVALNAWPKTGIVDAPHGRKTPAAHAVLAVGLVTFPDGTTTLLIKNSWGAGWGESGYGFMSRRYVDNYTITAHVLEPAP